MDGSCRPAWPPCPPTLRSISGRTCGRLKVSGHCFLSLDTVIFDGAVTGFPYSSMACFVPLEWRFIPGGGQLREGKTGVGKEKSRDHGSLFYQPKKAAISLGGVLMAAKPPRRGAFSIPPFSGSGSCFFHFRSYSPRALQTQTGLALLAGG